MICQVVRKKLIESNLVYQLLGQTVDSIPMIETDMYHDIRVQQYSVSTRIKTHNSQRVYIRHVCVCTHVLMRITNERDLRQCVSPQQLVIPVKQ